MKVICDKNICSGCACCVNLCPNGAIVLCENAAGEIHPDIQKQCIECHLCEKNCPMNREITAQFPKDCYAVQNIDCGVLKNSASGGFVAAAYNRVLEDGGAIVGVGLKNEYKYELTNNKTRIADFQNSKYVQSDAAGIYVPVMKNLIEGKTVLFVGLPCHVAGVLSFLSAKHVSTDKLITIDLVCHGVVPRKLLIDYLKSIIPLENDVQINFREPRYGTMKFILAISKADKEVYHAGVHRSDVYQEGYHGGFFYRESCYRCLYASEKRVADITVSDFPGYGKVENGTLIGKKTCVLVNTRKGEVFFSYLANEKSIIVERRPLQEAVEYNRQLKKPVNRSKEHSSYLALLNEGYSPYRAARKSILKHCFINELKYYSHYDAIYGFFSDHIPKNMKDTIKNALRRRR